MTTPLVTIIIALPAPTRYLDEALAGLERQTYRPFEVILLPDAPSGRAWPAWCRELPTGPARPAEKRNRGIAAARGEILAFLDDDAWPVEGWLAEAVRLFENPAVIGVGGPAVTPPDEPFWARAGGRVYANPLVSGSQRWRYAALPAREVDDVPSCNFLARTAAVRELGGFRVDFWPGEDTYLCAELTGRLGGKIAYDPRALVYHHRRALFLPHLRQIGRYGLHRGYFARHFPSTSRRIGYLLPSALVLGVVLGAVASVFAPGLRPVYGAGVGVYLLATFVGAFSQRPGEWLATWLGIIATHFVYGARFLTGWFARRLPGAIQRFDHPSEAPPQRERT